ncbi:MAG TPA: DUF2339 domain-containing protein [Bryobacteraceae bacterium]|nr:DUF2339 domain-containing protein [Bryobacteraceae bacterium]
MELLVIAVVAVCTRWILVRISAARKELTDLRRQAEHNDHLIAALTRRVYDLEARGQPAGTPLVVPLGPVTAPVDPVPSETHPDRDAAIPPPERPEPTTAEEDWETVVGTNWLNRAGALVLVIGIALFLGYSLTQLGPAGKIAIGFGTGLSILAVGVLAETHERYRNFSLSLIGAGWAVTYFAGYAMHALPAARILTDPLTGLAVLLGISTAMILHSLRYRSELATGMAFFFAFTGLNVTPATPFSSVATAVLAGSLLIVTMRFEWTRLSVAGVILTYGTYALRHPANPDPYGSPPLWIYWLLFEAFDLIGIRARGQRRGIERSLFGLNAAGLVFCTLAQNVNVPYRSLHLFYLLAALGYAASSSIRVRLLARDENAPVLGRLLAGGYEPAALASAAFMAAALISYYNGLYVPLALLIEGEAIWIAGLILSSSFLRGLGGVVLGISFLRFIAVDIWGEQTKTLMRLTFHAWSPLALLVALVFSINRVIRGGFLYTVAASILIASVVNVDFDVYWATATWSALAFLVLFLGVRLNKFDLRVQGYVAAFICFIRAAIVLDESGNEALGTMAAVFTAGQFYAAQWISRRFAAPKTETWGSPYLSVLATILVTIILYDAVQGRLLTVAIGGQAAALLAAGFALRERVLRVSGLVLFLVCIAKLFFYDLNSLDTLSRILSFIVLGIMLIAASWVYTRFREQIRRLL